MELTVVGSGSSGNSYILNDDGRRMILDAGMPWKEIQIACGFDVQSIDGCLITHSHLDHCEYANKALKNGVDCYTGEKCVEPVYYATGTLLAPLARQRWTHIGHWSVIPVEVHHDVPCYGFIIGCPSGDSVFYATDYSYIGVGGVEYTFKKMHLKHFLIAVNYTTEPDIEFWDSGHIYSGHSSLATVVDFLQGSITDKCKSITACHLSSRNADEAKIIEELSKIAPTATISIAKKGRTLNL